MLSDRVRRLRLQLIEIHSSPKPLDQLTLGAVILAIIRIEDHILDLEEMLPASSPEREQRSGNVINFPVNTRQ